MNSKRPRFDHEKLNVYHRSLRFITWTTELLERVSPKLSVHGQLDRASTSIPLNIAEGNGRFTSADRCRFFDIARGSTLEWIQSKMMSKIKNSAAIRLLILMFLLILISP